MQASKTIKAIQQVLESHDPRSATIELISEKKLPILRLSI
jgi:hypothetical protein